MALEFGPKLGFVVHADENENWYEELTRFLRAYDALVQCTAISHILNSPPGSPSDGDVYLLTGTPSGDWSGHAYKVARWSSKVDVWEFYTPRKGWLVWSDEVNNYMKYVPGEGWILWTTAIEPPVEEPDPLPKFQAAYGGAVLTGSDLYADAEFDHAGGASAVGYKTNYTAYCYVEFEVVTMPGTEVSLGIVGASVKPALEDGSAWGGYWFPGGTYKHLHVSAGGLYYKDGIYIDTGIPFAEGDRVGVAFDLGGDLAWLMVNGVAVDGGNPETGDGGFDISEMGIPLPFVGFSGGDACSIRIRPLEADQLHTPLGYSAWIPAGPP